MDENMVISQQTDKQEQKRLKNLERAKRYYWSNKEKVKAYKKAYQQKNKEHLNGISSKYYRQHKKEKNKKDNAKYRFGISSQEYNKLMENKFCPICECDETSGKTFVLDHCHITGKVRGVLCRGCNAALGTFKDDSTILNKAVKYLEKFR